MTVGRGASTRTSRLMSAMNRLDASIRRRLPAIYALLVLVLFSNDLASQLLHGPVRLTFASIKDVLLLVLVIPAVRRLSLVPRNMRWAVASILALVALAALRAPNLQAAVLEFRAVYWGLFLLLTAVVLASESLQRVVSTSLIVTGNLAAGAAIATNAFGMAWIDRVARSGGQIASNYFTYLDPSHPRAFTPFLEPNGLGAAMTLVIVSTVAGSPGKRRSYWLVLPLPVVALVLSASRSAILGLGLGLLVWAMTSHRAISVLWVGRARLWFAGGLVALAVGLLVIGVEYASRSGDPSARFHLHTLLDGPRTVLSHPFGLGLGRVGPRASIAFAHAIGVESSFLFIALELGVFGLGSFLWLLGILSVRYLRGVRWGSDPVGLAGRRGLATLAAALPTIILLGMIQATPTVWLWWLVWGTAFGVVSHGLPDETHPIG